MGVIMNREKFEGWLILAGSLFSILMLGELL
ncbi:hypothetical protein J2Y65_000768 [Aeromonas salmonicida]|uniref:Uncharacterized protein n=1 Tax=Aeromonas salmonicida TaxID=645 RepID=A0AAX1PMJ4_AERSA|nr:hypothetical protein [Aeromonas salmonicida]MDR7018667.1 hypothetical protein [Aeromonas salmonicida]RAJ09418.1 hypothetical protein DEU50_101146 [Aeromonas salmonicida]